MTTRHLVRGAAVALVVGLLGPIAWMMSASLLPESRVLGTIPWAGLLAPTSEHYAALIEERGFLLAIRNSLIVATLTTLVAVPCATLCAYALARLPMRGKGVLLAVLLAVSMFPQISIVAPLFLVLRAIGLLDTYPGLVLPYVTFTTPLAVWLLTGFFRQLPRDLEDAALIDGASRLRVIRDIVLPVAAPGLASTAILTFLYCWNEFLFALSFTLGPEHQTVPVAIALFRGRYQIPWGQVLAAASIATLPVVVIVLAFQRRIVAGLTAGAVKG